MKQGLVAVCTVLALACGGEDPPSGDAPAEGAPAVAAPPADPATIRSIAPTTGAPGTEVTIRAGGFPPGAAVEFGFGAPNTNFEILGQAHADSVGDVTTRLKVPDWAEGGRGYVFVVAPVNQPPRAASDTFRVTPR